MSTNKIMALIGNILMTITSLFALALAALFIVVLNDPYFSSDFAEGYYYRHDYSYDVNGFLTFAIVGIVIILLLFVVMNIFTWVAFAKMEGPHGRGWKIFLLVMGILNISSLFAGIFFILAFALNSGGNQPTEDTLSY